MADVKFTGGTAFVIAAQILGYLLFVGDFYTPGEAVVPEEDADAFEALLLEKSIPHTRWSI